MRRALLALLVLVLALVGVGCPCARSAVNASPELRWWLFSNFGASKICPEVLKRGIPLKLPQLGAASVGRFFPAHCHVEVDDSRRAIVMTTSGDGYLTLPFTRRIGFWVGVSIEYLPDFRLERDAMYVWGEMSRFVSPPDLRITGVENPVVNLATRTPIGDVATVIANGIVASEIGRGFTVVRQNDGDDFTLGHLEPPHLPRREFSPAEGRRLLASDLTSIFVASRDYLGPFEVTGAGASLYFHARVEGAPVTYTLVDRSVGEAWRREYERARPLAPPAGPALARGQLGVGEARLGFPVNPGTYYLVLENAAPPPVLGTALSPVEAVAYVSYSVEVGRRH